MSQKGMAKLQYFDYIFVCEIR